MGITFNYLVDSVQHANGLNDAADFLLTPLRELCDGRTYQVIYRADGSVDTVHEVAERVDFLAQNKIFACLLVLTVVPIALGLVIKLVAALGGAEAEYTKVQQWIHANKVQRPSVDVPVVVDGVSYCLDPSGVALVPPPLKNIEINDEDRQFYDIARYFEIFKEVYWVDDEHTIRPLDYYSKQAVFLGLKQQVMDTSTYWLTPEDLRDEIQAQIIARLEGILVAFDRGATHQAKVEALCKIADAAIVCTPTIIEATEDVYGRLSGRPFKDTIIAYAQALRENIVLMTVQLKGAAWHSVNPVRYLYGVELGLKRELMDQDDGWFYWQRPMTVEEFLAKYTVHALVSYVQTELNKYNLADAIVEFFRENDPRVENEEIDVRERFFEPVSAEAFSKWLEANQPMQRQKELLERHLKQIEVNLQLVQIIAAQLKAGEHAQALTGAQVRLAAYQQRLTEAPNIVAEAKARRDKLREEMNAHEATIVGLEGDLLVAAKAQLTNFKQAMNVMRSYISECEEYQRECQKAVKFEQMVVDKLSAGEDASPFIQEEIQGFIDNLSFIRKQIGQFEIALRTQVNIAGVVAILKIVGLVCEGDEALTRSAVGLGSSWFN